MRIPRVAAVVTALMLLAGCGGGASSGGLGATIPKQSSGTAGSVRFAVTVPQKTTASGRSPAYVSPSTQSMTIAVMQGTTSVLSQTVGLTSNSTGCTSSAASTTCTLDLTLNAGSYTASITTYDGTNGTGNALSTAQSVAFTVTANQSTLVPLTLSGIPTAIKVLSAGTNAVDVLAQDADGNFIIGAGAPTFAVSASSGPAVGTVTQPTASHPNLVSFAQASPIVNGTETFSISASYPAGESNACTQTGAVCALASAVTAIGSAPMAMFANHLGNVILGYTLPLTSTTQSPAVSVPLASASLLAEDASGNLFASSGGTNPATVLEISPPYIAATVTNTLGGNMTGQVAVSPNGDLMLTNGSGMGGGWLYEPPYTAPPIVSTDGFVGGSTGVAFDASGNVYFGGATMPTVTMIAPPYNSAPMPVGTSGVPIELTVSGNTLLVGESTNVDIFSLPLSGSSTPSATLTSGVDAAYGTVLDASGNLWIANFQGGTSGNGSIEEFTKPFITGESPTVTINLPVGGTSTSYNPWGIAFDPAGNLYVTTTSGGSTAGGVLEFSPPFSNTSTPTMAIETATIDSPNALVITPMQFSVTP